MEPHQYLISIRVPQKLPTGRNGPLFLSWPNARVFLCVACADVCACMWARACGGRGVGGW